MKNTHWSLSTLVVLAAVVIAAGLPSDDPFDDSPEGSFEYRFVQTGSWTTSEDGERIGYLEGAEVVCTKMSDEGWDLVSSNVVSKKAAALGFARLTNE